MVNTELISLRKMFENGIIMNENIALVVYNECFHGNSRTVFRLVSSSEFHFSKFQ